MAPKIAIVYDIPERRASMWLSRTNEQYFPDVLDDILIRLPARGGDATPADYSMYGHIRQLAEAEKKGIEKAGGTADLFHTLEAYDAFLIGIPTRYGNFPTQWKAFWDKTGKQWSTGGFWGKLAGLFISTASLGGGQESTAIAAMSTFAHHGIIYVPFGFAKAFPLMADLSEVHGGGPWGAGTFAGPDGSRQPTAKELEIATIQGEAFYQTVAKHVG
ncbi:minor allergen Alt a 7 [Colletotrichum liriopes]|uniref:Minor allergen Alt a 7 n=1 Tax=Colletotrichum liriopes TaxID=708192 RepID=A0AA37GQJ7_9PEZI|nr:minor allergen Alt a 7 [Colletotrichum liriopes]